MSVVEIAPGFYNIRGHFKRMAIDLGTHMSLVRLASGKFLVIDAVEVTPEIKAGIDALTDGGANIEAVVFVHPFHTLHCMALYRMYPHAIYVGCPRHLRLMKEIPWAGDLNVCEWRDRWAPEVQMRIPAGAEFVNPLPERSNHFNSVFVFHATSRTLHVDDTILYFEHVPLLARLVIPRGSMKFHFSMKGPGLLPHPDSAFVFRDWMNKLVADWDVENLCTAHTGNKIGGARAQIQALIQSSEATFQKLSQQKRKHYEPGHDKDLGAMNPQGNECG
eukprot:TRINITY_DN8173_c0_g1_i2.p1 TRINITY_DN8173_c0_g1~~TRINITY_DN8173_c0_g1_i2.p1  ORF type:complete len:276 (+),score=80.18 TRINITY_DN8173_c0_g1_i2:103-930(+)